MRWTALYRRLPILLSVSASQILAEFFRPLTDRMRNGYRKAVDAGFTDATDALSKLPAADR